MIKDIYYARETQREIAIWGIAEQYSADFDETADLFNKLIELNLPIEHIEEIAKSGEYQKGGTK